jgi:protein-tyrosine phosphatase
MMEKPADFVFPSSPHYAEIVNNVYLTSFEGMQLMAPYVYEHNKNFVPVTFYNLAAELERDVERISKSYTRRDIYYKSWALDDSPQQNLLDTLDERCAEILQLAEDGVVVIFCHLGVSRSATLACAILIKKFPNYIRSADEAIELVKRKRPVIKPNSNFKNQLQTFYFANKIRKT